MTEKDPNQVDDVSNTSLDGSQKKRKKGSLLAWFAKRKLRKQEKKRLKKLEKELKIVPFYESTHNDIQLVVPATGNNVTMTGGGDTLSTPKKKPAPPVPARRCATLPTVHPGGNPFSTDTSTSEKSLASTSDEGTLSSLEGFPSNKSVEKVPSRDTLLQEQVLELEKQVTAMKDAEELALIQWRHLAMSLETQRETLDRMFKREEERDKLENEVTQVFSRKIALEEKTSNLKRMFKLKMAKRKPKKPEMVSVAVQTDMQDSEQLKAEFDLYRDQVHQLRETLVKQDEQMAELELLIQKTRTAHAEEEAAILGQITTLEDEINFLEELV